jgi:hypothetical protein
MAQNGPRIHECGEIEIPNQEFQHTGNVQWYSPGNILLFGVDDHCLMNVQQNLVETIRRKRGRSKETKGVTTLSISQLVSFRARINPFHALTS